MDYPSIRQPVFAAGGMVATSQPLAAQAGLSMLREGGNAVDAAIATAVALTVLEPTSNGIGSDMFALVWSRHENSNSEEGSKHSERGSSGSSGGGGGRLYGLNASGRAPASLTLDSLPPSCPAYPGIAPAKRTPDGDKELPGHGWLPVTVPGAPRGWADLHMRFGRLPFARLFEPAIRYAREGFPLSPVVARNWAAAIEDFEKLRREQRQKQAQEQTQNGKGEGDTTPTVFDEWHRIFAPSGFEPRPGAMFRSHDHADTLTALANSRCEALYTGELATRIAQHSATTGGRLQPSDLAAHTCSEWVTPIHTSYRGHRVHEIPPNGQGIAALIALGVLERMELATDRDDAATLHAQIEAMKLGFADAHRYVADPQHVTVPTEALLNPEYLAARRSEVGDEALNRLAGDPASPGTVYLAAASQDEKHGLQMVSLIQSNYMGFGSGVVVPGTGIALQNRGHNFSLNPNDSNCLKPGKRPYHTIIPGFMTRIVKRSDGSDEEIPVGPFGVMGGFMQPQGHVQVVVNTLKYGLNAQQALDAPRWQWIGGSNGKVVEVEHEVVAETARKLVKRGHDIKVNLNPGSFGRGQIIWWNDETKVFEGATEGRADGVVAAF